MTRQLIVLGVALQLSWFAGCGGPPEPETIPTFPVTGVVNIDGKPTPMVRVLLFPVEKKPEWIDPRLAAPHWGNTGPDGKFQITTYSSGDGAPVGEYLVFFCWEGNPPVVPLSNPDEPPIDPIAAKFNGKYGNAMKAQVPNIKVVEGQPTDVGTLELTTK